MKEFIEDSRGFRIPLLNSLPPDAISFRDPVTGELARISTGDYTKPIARSGEQQFACILRNRSGQDAGCIDYGLRDCTFLSDAEQQDICNTAFAMYQNICSQVGKKALGDKPR